MDEEARIRACWDANAAAWAEAVRGGGIRSRRVATDAAIVDAVLARRPRSVLDIGCGEGWLARALAEQGVDVLGVDAAEALIDQARARGGRFRVLSQEALAQDTLDQRFDVVACNFALFGQTVVERLLAQLPSLLEPGGAFVMQTLHPPTACGDAPYRDGWRDGSWIGCGDGFDEAPPWYFRTVSSWLALLQASGLQLAEMYEPVDPDTGHPLSLLLVAEPTRGARSRLPAGTPGAASA